MTLPPGTRLGPYEIGAPIGAGGMGEVYRARDPRLGRDVAIKILPGEWSRDPERLRRFEQEARAAGILNHPNILAVHDVGRHEGTPYVVTELLEGESLRDRLAGAALSPRKAIDLGIQIAHGLAAAHHAGIVHRDLKPGNVFITRDGRVKILDFGLAKLRMPDGAPGGAEPRGQGASLTETVAADTGPGQVWGTVGYMSPEQVRGKPVDHRSDIFAFGAVLYEMLTGRRAFRGESSADTMSAILREDPAEMASPGHTLPPALERIVRHCLEKNPEERFQSARDLAFDLETLTGLSGTSEAAPARGSAAGPIWRRFVAVSAIIVAVLGAGAAGSWLARREKPVEPDYHQVTFRRGTIRSARFTPDGNTIVYSAAWDGAPPRIYTARSDSPDSRSLDIGDATLESVSRTGELAIYRVERDARGDLRSAAAARVPLAGGTPRDVFRGVNSVEWGPDSESFAIVRSTPRGMALEYPVGTTRLQVYGKIDGVRFSPDGRSLACWSHPQLGDTKGKVVLVPLDDRPRDLTPIWGDAAGLAWRPDGREIWFTAAREGLDRALYAVDLGGKVRLLARIPGSLTIHDIASDGRALLTRDLMRMSMRGLGAGAGEERDLSWYDWTFANSITPDGKTVFFNESGEGSGRAYAAFLRPTSGGPAVRLGAGTPRSIAPDGASVIVLTQEPSAVLQVPIGAGAPRTIPTDGIVPIDATWHPDGRRVFVSGLEEGSGGRWYVIDIATGARRAVTDEGVFPRRAVASPDGRWLAAGRGGGQILLYPLEEGSKRALVGADTTTAMIPLHWAPDGRSLLCMPFEEQFPRRIYRLDVRTGTSTLVREVRPPDSTGVAWAGGFDITPDARHYAYSYAQLLSDLYVVTGLR